jgi:hypothetical protein
LTLGACPNHAGRRPPDGGRSSSGLLQITRHRRRYRRPALRRGTALRRSLICLKGDQREIEVNAQGRTKLPESAVVFGRHSPPRWVDERAIYMAAPVAYGELVIQTVGATDMSGALV